MCFPACRPMSACMCCIACTPSAPEPSCNACASCRRIRGTSWLSVTILHCRSWHCIWQEAASNRPLRFSMENFLPAQSQNWNLSAQTRLPIGTRVARTYGGFLLPGPHDSLKNMVPTERDGLSRARKPFAIWLLLAGLSAVTAPGANEVAELTGGESESVELAGVLYDVPSPWKGRRISSSVDPAALVPLPSQLTGQRQIYVTRKTRDAFVTMASQALKADIRLEVDSGFRSYRYQKQILERVLARGVPFDQAVQRIAPPGYSEHITGTAVDIVPSNGSFGNTAAYEWLLENAGEFCFRESYPKSNDGGYAWEPWHWRFEACGDQTEGPLREQAGKRPQMPREPKFKR